MISALALALLTAPWNGEEETHIGYFVETKVTRMVGMDMDDLPEGLSLPNVPGMELLSGKPQRSLQIRLWSRGIAPNDASAFVVPPPGLRLGERLDLKIHRPDKEIPQEEQTEPEQAPGKLPDFTLKIYWGSSAKVRDGQPKVFNLKDLSSGLRTGVVRQWMQAQADRAGRSDAFRPDWTTAYWPHDAAPARIAPDASLTGTFRLESTYAGGVALEVPKGIDFLAPFELTRPDLAEFPDFGKALELHWKPIKNLLGIHGSILAMQGGNTLILWFAAENWDEKSDAEFDFLQMAEVRRLVEEKALLKGDVTTATVPAGIFKDADLVSLTMVGYGPGVALSGTRPVPRLQTKTTLNAVLGGRMFEEE